VDEYAAGRISLTHYRGRTCWSFAVQAAERRIREDEGFTGLDDLSLVKAEKVGEERWVIAFDTPKGRRENEVAVELGELTQLTCKSETPKRPLRYVATPC
jgi:hypothetical protein